MSIKGLQAGFWLSILVSFWMTGCGGGGSPPPPPPSKITPTVAVTPGSNSITKAQSLTVTVTVSGSGGTPTGTVTLTSGAYTSAATLLTSGGASITIPAGSLVAGNDSLSVSYTPDAAGSSTYNSASGTASVTVTTVMLIIPTVTVSPGSNSITVSQALTVTLGVSGGGSNPTPTGTVTLSSGTYTSPAMVLTAGSASITVPAGSLALGTDNLSASYTPDATSSSTYGSALGTASVAVTLIMPAVTVSPGSSSITTVQPLTVTVGISGGGSNPIPTGTVTLSSGTYTSSATVLTAGSASIAVPAGSLALGTDNLSASYTPDATSSPVYISATGTGSVTVTSATPFTLTVNSSAPSSGISISPVSPVDISGASSGTTPFTRSYYSGTQVTLSAALSSNGYSFVSWSGCTSTSGSGGFNCNVTVSANTTVTANYNQNPITSITVDQLSTGPAVTDQLLGMNLASWYDVVGNATAVNGAFAQAGIKAIRWPGGSWSDEYHWQTPNSSSNPSLPYICGNNSSGVPNGSTTWGGYSTFAQFVTGIVQGGNYDLALTADYGTDTACTGPGQPSEAASWVTSALRLGITVSHMTVGNEEYGTWETDLHSPANDATTYAAAVAGSAGYYALIKAASPNTLVGVSVNPGNSPAWDPPVLAGAPYDFVEYHYYPETPGQENDTFLVQQAAQELTTNINTIKSELKTAGKASTPIYVGEIGATYSNPGKQSWSLTQGLYAGQVLGEMMNAGVSRLTWWIGFGNCNGDNGNDSSSVYGWQNFGAYNVFADGAGDTGGTNNSPCNFGGPIGTMSPTARAFQLFSNLAVTGENVLTASVAGDKTDVRAYAATHSGGTALVVFNLNETASVPVTIALSAQSAATTVTVETYDKAIYDLSGSPAGTPPDPSGTSTWAPPTTTSFGAQSLPLSLTLAPWSMNVVIVH